MWGMEFVLVERVRSMIEGRRRGAGGGALIVEALSLKAGGLEAWVEEVRVR
jgi:hypothetical protein